jgi:hypothetical protein
VGAIGFYEGSGRSATVPSAQLSAAGPIKVVSLQRDVATCAIVAHTPLSRNDGQGTAPANGHAIRLTAAVVRIHADLLAREQIGLLGK